MNIDIRRPSGEHYKVEVEPNEIVPVLNNDVRPRYVVDGVGKSVRDIDESLQAEDGEEDVHSPSEYMGLRDVTVLEPLAFMEFESHCDAYAFYQEYARSVAFYTAIKNSRRSKISREFIDAKFACSRYGRKREYKKSVNRPRSRQESNHDTESSRGRRAYAKTDCKAGMHVKKRSDGKWIIHRFEKEHNHELLPAQPVSEQIQRIYAAMERKFAEQKNAVGIQHDARRRFKKARDMTMDVGEEKVLLEFLVDMQSLNSNFFYALDVGEDQRLKNILWIDAKGRHDYTSFSDVVSFDTTYIRKKYKVPLALFVGVNQHYQFILLGCAVLSDESPSTFLWVMQTWMKAMGRQAPKVMITDKDQDMEAVISEVFPSTLHFYGLWYIMRKVSKTMNQLVKHDESFMPKLIKCIYRSWTDEEFDKRWHKLIDRFDLSENDLFQSLYDSRKKWVPTFMKDGCLAGMSTCRRSDSVNSFFDRYLHRKTVVQDFVNQYDAIILDRYAEEAKASYDTLNKQPVLKSPSPFEKHLARVYTHAVFRKFQHEVLGSVGCTLKRDGQINGTIIFKVLDHEWNQEFTVTFNELKSEVSCICHSFELKGFFCRHVLLVLQMRCFSTIPSQYILKRWTKYSKRRNITGDELSEEMQSRLQRYNDLCQRGMKLGEEGSLSQESYNQALRVLDDALENCLSANRSSRCITETSPLPSPGWRKTNKKKNSTKKRKASMEPDVITVGPRGSLQQMGKPSSGSINFDGFFEGQHGVDGMLNVMAPPRNS